MNPLLNDYAMEKQVKLTIEEIQIINEYLKQMYSQAGVSKNWSLLVLDDIAVFNGLVNIINHKLKMAGVLPPDRADEYNQKKNELCARFVDRDEQGQGKFDTNNEPIITDMIVEYNEALDTLNKQYPEVVSFVPNADSDVFSETLEFLFVVPKEYRLLPEQLPPILLEIFQRFYV